MVTIRCDMSFFTSLLRYKYIFLKGMNRRFPYIWLLYERIIMLYWSLYHFWIIIPFNQTFSIKSHIIFINFLLYIQYTFTAWWWRGIVWFIFVMKGIDQSIKFFFFWKKRHYLVVLFNRKFPLGEGNRKKKTFSTFLTKQVGLKLYIM